MYVYETTWTEPTDTNVLYALKQRIRNGGVLDPVEMREMVAAFLASDRDAHAAHYARTDAAVETYATSWIARPRSAR